MEANVVRRALLNLRSNDGKTGVRVDILQDSRVRLQVRTPTGTQGTEWETLEDMALHAATEPALSSELYNALMWELDLMGLSGA